MLSVYIVALNWMVFRITPQIAQQVVDSMINTTKKLSIDMIDPSDHLLEPHHPYVKACIRLDL